MKEKYDITVSDGLAGAKPKKIANKKKHRESSLFYLSVAGQIGYAVALPLVFGALIGSFLGNALVGLGIGTVISIIGFVQVVKKLL